MSRNAVADTDDEVAEEAAPAEASAE